MLLTELSLFGGGEEEVWCKYIKAEREEVGTLLALLRQSDRDEFLSRVTLRQWGWGFRVQVVYRKTTEIGTFWKVAEVGAEDMRQGEWGEREDTEQYSIFLVEVEEVVANRRLLTKLTQIFAAAMQL